MNERRVLIVEDCEPLLVAIQCTLQYEGYAVSTATNGVQALLVMEGARPDVIVADVLMPQMDGYALCKAVRSRREWAAIPFIFLTALGGQIATLRGMEIGADDYITKPCSSHELLAVIRSRLKRARDIQKSDAAELERAKEQIATILGHELRTPLTYIRGYTDLLLEGLHSFPQDTWEYVQALDRGADRLCHLVEDVLLLTKLDTGEAEEQFTRTAQLHDDLPAILGRSILQYEEQAKEQGVTLQTVVELDIPPVRLHAPFFVDALGRLVDNGVKFSLDAVKEVTVSACVKNGWVNVAVSDRGVGIPPADLPHLFERFRQIDRERMERQGTGLGLAIARGLIRLHGGNITVESTPGEGSVFTILLPAYTGASKQDRRMQR